MKAEDILVPLIQKASDGIDAAVSFSQQQIPEVIHQLLLWKFSTSLFWCVVSTIVTSVSIALFINLAKGYTPDSGDEAFLWMFVIVIFIFGTVLVCSFDWLQIWIAPKLYLIEYAATLAKR